MSGPVYREAPLPGVTIVVPGYPDDGGLYVEIGPVSDTRGERVVTWYRGQHIYGRALSDPMSGEHLDPRHERPVEDRVAYWVEFVSEVNLAAYLRGERADADGQPLTEYVRTTRIWLAPVEGIPTPRAGRTEHVRSPRDPHRGASA
jgi:hypothetical protein